MVLYNEEVKIKVEENYEDDTSDEHDEQSWRHIDSAVEEIFADTVETELKFEQNILLNEDNEDSTSNGTAQPFPNSCTTEIKIESNAYTANEDTNTQSESTSSESINLEDSTAHEAKPLSSLCMTEIKIEDNTYTSNKDTNSQSESIFLESTYDLEDLEDSTANDTTQPCSSSCTTEVKIEANTYISNGDPDNRFEFGSLSNVDRLLNAATENCEFASEALSSEDGRSILSNVKLEVNESTSNIEQKPVVLGDNLVSLGRSLKSNNVEVSLKDTDSDKLCELNEHSVEFEEDATNMNIKSEPSELLRHSEESNSYEGQSIILKKISKENPILRDVKVVLEKIDTTGLGLHRKTFFNGTNTGAKYRRRDGGAQTVKKTHKCEICGKRFVHDYNWKKHLRKHATEKPFKCDICQMEFICLSRLKTHFLIHEGKKAFKCRFCGRGFTQKGTMQAHVRTHTGEKPFKCDKCDKGFSRSDNLQLHVRTHTGDKPYVCRLCKKGFSSSSSLRRHIRIHSGEKPYKCDICEKTFTRDKNLEEHLRIHTGERPFKCDVCGARFARRNSIKGHMIVHTGVKAYKCDLCDSKFTKKTSLNRHVSAHTGKMKLHKCDICEKKFTRKDHLQKHIPLHTK